MCLPHMRTTLVSGVVSLCAPVFLVSAGCSSSSGNAGADAGGSAEAGFDGGPMQDAGGEGGTCGAADYRWAVSGGGAGQNDHVYGVAVDKSGNTWITGTFIGSAQWGGVMLSAADTVHPTAFVGKLDPSGNVLFARALQAGSSGAMNITNYGRRVRVDASGNAYVAGEFQKALDLDGVHLTTTSGNGSAFLLALDPTGKALWGVETSNAGGDGEHGYDVAIDAQGDAYLVGSYNGQAVFGSLKVTGNESDQAIFVAKYSPASSDWVWAKGWVGINGGANNDGGVASAVAVSADGGVYVSGIVNGTASIDGVPLSAAGGAFIAKLGASDGQLAWATEVLPPDDQHTVNTGGLAVDASGALYLTGGFSGSAAVFQPTLAAVGDGGAGDAGTGSADAAAGSLSLSTTSGGADVFLAKYDPSGMPLWAKHAGASNPGVARGDDVTIAAAGVYVSGYQQGPTVFDGKTLSKTSNFFVAKYDASGAIQWVQGAAAADNDGAEGSSLAVDPTNGDVVVGGSYTGSVTFGSAKVTSSGNDDGLVTRLCD